MFSFWSENTSPRKTVSTIEIGGSKMVVLTPGTVLAMQLFKGGQSFKIINLNITLQEIVKNFLSKNCGGVDLPVSFTESENTRPKLISKNRMAMSLRENLGRKFNVVTEGLTFSIGPVNSKLCYKMCVCDLGQLQKMFSLTQGGKCDDLEMLDKSCSATSTKTLS